MTPIYDRHLDDEGKFFLQHGCMFAPPHYHHAIEIVCVPAPPPAPSTDAEWIINGVSEKPNRPMIALIDGETVHTLTAAAPDCYCLILPKSYARAYYRAKSDRVLAGNFITDPDFVARVLPLILSLPALEANALAFSGAVDLLLALLSEKLGLVLKKVHQLALDILSYIRIHCAEDIDLSSLAQKMGYHKCYLSKCIHTYFAVGFTTLVNTERYRLFCKLQAEHDDRLANIYDAGFRSTSTFYRFCREQGLHPDEARLPPIRHRP